MSHQSLKCPSLSSRETSYRPELQATSSKYDEDVWFSATGTLSRVSGNDLWLKQQDCRAHFYISRCRFFKKENMTAKNNNKNPPKLRNMQTSVCILRWEDRDEVKLAHWSSVGRMPHTWSAEAVIQAPCRWTQHFLCFVPVQVCQIGAFIWIWRSVVFFPL